MNYHASKYAVRSLRFLRRVSVSLLRPWCRLNPEFSEAKHDPSEGSRSTNAHGIQDKGDFQPAPSGRWAQIHKEILFGMRAFAVVALFGLGCVSGWAQQNDQQQMRGLDEQVQEVKTDVLKIAEELSQLEEKLLYPSGTQFAVFVALAKGDLMRLDAVRLQVDGQLVAHYIYSFKELEALRKGGVQRIYVGNIAVGEHKLEVVVDGKLDGGADFSNTEHFTFRKEVKPKLVELTVAGPGSGNTPIALGEL